MKDKLSQNFAVVEFFAGECILVRTEHMSLGRTLVTMVLLNFSDYLLV